MKRKPPRLKRLTAGEQTALAFIIDYRQREGRFPSLRQHAAKAECTHQNVSLYRRSLANKGWLALDGAGVILTAVAPVHGYTTLSAVDATPAPS